MREEFLLEDIFGILDSLFLGHTRLGPPHADKVQSHILFLDYKGLIQRWLELERGRDYIFLIIAVDPFFFINVHQKLNTIPANSQNQN